MRNLGRLGFLIFGFWLSLTAASDGAERRQLTYHARALGFPIGEISLDLHVAADGAAASARLHTAGIADLIEPIALAASSEAVWEDGAIRWRSYSIDHVYAAKRRITWMQRQGETVHSVITPRYRLWGMPPADAASIAAANDPLTGLLSLAASTGAHKTCAAQQLIFDGKQLYSLELLPAKGARAWRTPESGSESGPLEGAQLRCALRYRPLRGFDPEDRPRKPIRDAEIWFAFPGDATLAVPVRLRVRLGFGALDIRLRRASRAQILIDTNAPAPLEGPPAAAVDPADGS